MTGIWTPGLLNFVVINWNDPSTLRWTLVEIADLRDTLPRSKLRANLKERMGSDGLRRRGRIWHIDTCFRGHRIRQSCETDNRNQAVSILRQRQAEVDRRGPLALRTPKLTFTDLARDFITDYRVNGKRSVGKAEKSVAHLAQYFGGYRAVNITSQHVRAYIEKRQQAGLANGTINRELAALKRMLRLALDATLLPSVPKIKLLREAAPRSGFFEADQFQALLRHLRPEIRPVAQFAYELAWRLREVINLEWRQVNLGDGSVRLDPGSTKNGEGRVAYLSPQLLAILRVQHAATRELEREKGIIIPWVFHRKGRRILRFLASWQTACKKAGVPGMLFHDLRRTAVRNMVRAGVPERVAMQISGHRTRSVFERYNITNDADLREAATRIAAHNNGSADRHHSFAGDPATTGSLREGT